MNNNTKIEPNHKSSILLRDNSKLMRFRRKWDPCPTKIKPREEIFFLLFDSISISISICVCVCVCTREVDKENTKVS